MTDHRIIQSVAERLDIELQRQPNPLLRRRRRVTWAAGVLSLLCVAALGLRGDRTVYWARPVAAPHRFFENDCQACHSRKWQPAVRLVTGNNAARSVLDEDCQRCHNQRSDDHCENSAASPSRGCVTCHAEHRGHGDLTRVADAHCVECHGDLQTSPPAARSFVASIRSFQDHPEFALRRQWPSEPRETSRLLPGARHQVHQLAELKRSGEEGGEWLWADRAKLRFNHAKHLEPLLLPWDHPQQAADGRKREQLGCAACHEPNEDGKYMRPINYERHCADCHPLRFSSRLEVGGPLPHGDPVIVQGVMRDRFMAYARQHAEEVFGRKSGVDGAADTELLLIPKSPDGGRAKDEWEWVEAQLRAENGVLQNTKNGCALCHEAGAPSPDDASAAHVLGLTIATPHVPRRWMPHSRFDHRSHLAVQCVACHDPEYQEKRQSRLQKPAPAVILDSDKTSDILMPSIAVCRKCHGSERQSTARQARSNCVVCHGYHHGDPLANLPELHLDQLLRLEFPASRHN